MDCPKYIKKSGHSFHERLQFILEINDNNQLNFLEVTILIDDYKIIFDRYSKSTYSGRYINFYSQHPLAQKRSIFGLVDRICIR